MMTKVWQTWVARGILEKGICYKGGGVGQWHGDTLKCEAKSLEKNLSINSYKAYKHDDDCIARLLPTLPVWTLLSSGTEDFYLQL